MDEGLLEKLFIWGCDTDEALLRVMDDEELYLSFLHKYCVDEDIEKLEKYIVDKDADNAHSLAHTMKGVYGNLGITPMYELLSDIVNILRSGTFTGLDEKIDELKQTKEEFDDIVK